MKFKKFIATLSSPLSAGSLEVALCATSESSARKYLQSYGTFKVDVLDDATDRYPISLTSVAMALSNNFDETEIRFICDALERTGVGSFDVLE